MSDLKEILSVVHETRDLVIQERKLNNDRFVQLSSGFHELEKRVETKVDEVKEKVDQIYSALTEDIQAVVFDVEKLKRRSA